MKIIAPALLLLSACVSPPEYGPELVTHDVRDLPVAGIDDLVRHGADIDWPEGTSVEAGEGTLLVRQSEIGQSRVSDFIGRLRDYEGHLVRIEVYAGGPIRWGAVPASSKHGDLVGASTAFSTQSTTVRLAGKRLSLRVRPIVSEDGATVTLEVENTGSFVLSKDTLLAGGGVVVKATASKLH